MPDWRPSEPSRFYAAIGASIAERRAALGLDIAAFAARLDVTPEQAHAYEQGNLQITEKRLRAIALSLGVGIDDLVGDVIPALTPDCRQHPPRSTVVPAVLKRADSLIGYALADACAEASVSPNDLAPWLGQSAADMEAICAGDKPLSAAQLFLVARLLPPRAAKTLMAVVCDRNDPAEA